jgi:hypothetical protein
VTNTDILHELAAGANYNRRYGVADENALKIERLTSIVMGG